MNQRCLLCGRSSGYLIALFQQSLCTRGLYVGMAVDGAERLAGIDFVADLLMHGDAYRGIDRIFFAFAASAEDDAGGSNLLAQNGRHVPGTWTRNIHVMLRAGQARGIVNCADIASLQLDHLAEPLEGFA